MTREEKWDEVKTLAFGVLTMLAIVLAVLLFHEQPREDYGSWNEKPNGVDATAN